MTRLISMLCGLCVVFAFQANALAQTITNQPQSSLTVNNASAATFTVGASGATTYQWKFNGTNLSDTGTNQSVPGSIGGSTTSTLSLENVTSNQAGTYTVLINGTLTSSNAVLAIIPGTIVTFTFSGIIGGGASNMTVQLFDHDKPVTVANFLHYIRSGAYSNMFMQRITNGLALQGGSYGTSNRTDPTPPIYGWDVSSKFTLAANQNPPFPPQITGEFYNGPQIKNDFGTISMALQSGFLAGGLPNTGRNGFFFNLADNSSLTNSFGIQVGFDSANNGPFTVFGRIITGTNVLNYFNDLMANGGGVAVNDDFIDQGTDLAQAPGFPVFPTLPVNYLGTNAPANANLVYCDFNTTTNIPVDTVAPSVLITNPPADTMLTGGPIVSGDANDDVAVALVTCVLTPQATDGIYANGGLAVTNFAVGTTNWSLTFMDYDGIAEANLDNSGYMLPGTYNLTVQSQDGAGNVSPPASEMLTLTAVVTNGIGTVSFTNNANNPIGYPFQEGNTYVLQATAGTNQIFVDWSGTNRASGQTATSFYPMLTFGMSDGLLLAATFISNDFPGSIAFTFPPTNGATSSSNFNISGTLSSGLPNPVTVTCMIFSTNTGLLVMPPLTTNVTTTNWSIAVSNLPTGAYRVQAVAVDSAGESTMIAENFFNEVAVSITTPAANALFYEDSPMLLQGTATSYAGLASVGVVMIPQVAADGKYPADQLFTSATGTTNWSLSLSNAYGYVLPGEYNLMVTARDNAGNSNTQSQLLTISAVQINGNGTVSFAQGVPSYISPVGYPFQVGTTYVLEETPGSNWALLDWAAGNQTFTSPGLSFSMSSGTFVTANFVRATPVPLHLVIVGNGTVSPVTNGEYLPFGTNFTVTATPGSGASFYGWNVGTQVFTNATQSFTMTSNMTLTAEFISSGATKVLSFTHPTANAKLMTNNFPLTLSGKIAAKVRTSPITSAQITCQIFSATSTNDNEVVPPLTTTTTGGSTWSVIVPSLPPDKYEVEAVAVYTVGGTQQSSAISEKFSVLDFKAVAGTYSGLFICDTGPVTPTNSGFFTFTLSASGSFSSKMLFPAYRPISLNDPSFFADGIAGFTLNLPQNPITVYINLNLTNGTDTMTGYVSNPNAWYSPLVCYRAVTKLSTQTIPATGKYIFDLPFGSPTNNPATNGYASLAIGNSGVLSLSGALPDGATFSQSARVSKDAAWPLYVIPAGYGYGGMLMGWETWQTNGAGSYAGQLYWYKPGAVHTNMNSTGTNYVRPAAGNYSIVFQGGTLTAPLTNMNLTVNNSGQFAVPRPAPADKLAISISAYGVITGHFVPPNATKPLQFKGAFFGQSKGGSGYILEGNGQTGTFLLEQQ